jgi:hypothetical protein
MRTETPIATCANDAAENAANNIVRTIPRAIETLIVFNAVIRFSGLTNIRNAPNVDRTFRSNFVPMV